MTTRGIRNNNPGNIDHNDANKWLGELPVDKAIEPRFCRFLQAEYGIRALAKLLLNYQKKSGCSTIKAIINKWAPPIENDTGAYYKAVANACGVLPDDVVEVAKILEPLVKAIITHENGSCPYSDVVIQDGCNLAR